MSLPTGAVCHMELYAVNLEASGNFYRNIFDWVTSPHDQGYGFWKDPNGLSGGFTTAGSPVTNPAATFYIKVDQIGNKLHEITTQGGVIIKEKTKIGGDHGFYALFRDPAGNNVGLWSAE